MRCICSWQGQLTVAQYWKKDTVLSIPDWDVQLGEVAAVAKSTEFEFRIRKEKFNQI